VLRQRRHGRDHERQPDGTQQLGGGVHGDLVGSDYSFNSARSSRTYWASSRDLNSRCATRNTPARSRNSTIGSRSTPNSRPVWRGVETSSGKVTPCARANFSARGRLSSRLTPTTTSPALE